MTTYDFISANKRKTAILMAVFFAFILLLGWAIDRYYGSGSGEFLMIAAVYSTGTALVSYYSGDKVALWTSGARRPTEPEYRYFGRLVENLCLSIGLPAPQLYVIDDPAINAFATGRDPKHASVAVTTGALQKLANEELEGVLAHEISHVRNYDIRLMTIVVVLVGIVSLIGNLFFRMSWRGSRRRDSNGGGLLAIVGLILLIFAPLIAQLIKLAVSRKREFLADASGALLTRFPEGLARALGKIQQESRPMARASAATAHLFIASPFSGRSVAALFATHPPVEARIQALLTMSAPAL